ncbi:MAG: acetylxylan esterase [Bacteroidetes bacterium GWD2_45_23]|nr:MAG: acetylxylan esterase [Bacteroidetes bacterium GWC2_46_850]OFX68550.1 MAG: acetylxylan esterase [Bacteroidetes bacterium GWC1_47_7]OFX87384.1 MAG: acetylxylan esterase [Bacteroidetes bacterium GWD2_45_23]HAR37385.1 acetylxylan esterase [Porphyromonadaceae bacterium]HBB01642.1 acetylxylan esterase [Porphyromonadaceae bacterium]
MKKNFGLLLLWLSASLAFTQQKANYDESKVPAYILPELLKCRNGEMVTTVNQWEKQRRPELMELFASHMYGHTPAENIDVSYEIMTENREAMGGKATSKQVKFTFSNGNKKLEAFLLIYIPNKPKGKVPVFVGYNFKGNHSTTTDTTILYSPAFSLVREPGHPDWERGTQTSRWNYDLIIDRGYAIASMCYHDIFPDKPELKDHSVISLFSGYNPQKTDPGEWQAIGAWAWGSSRIVDFLETQERIDTNKIAIMGHSRQGKAALWAGAQDPRFRIVISNDSGCGGAALFRRKFGETAEIINNAFPHWFCENFRQYNNQEELMPVDQHQLLALIAPRKVYVASAEDDQWADPRGEFLSAYHAGPIYRLYGLSTIGTDQMPELHTPIMEDIGYHMRAGKHDVTDYDWERFLDFADKHFKN